MTNLTRLRLILVDLSGLMKTKTYLKQNVLFVKRGQLLTDKLSVSLVSCVEYVHTYKIVSSAMLRRR